MNKIAGFLGVLSITILAATTEVDARGGRGGGGVSRGGGGGYSRPAPAASRTPSVSRPAPQPSSRPQVSRPSTQPSVGTRPSTGTRPSPGTRPSTGGRPSQGQLNDFLDLSGPSTGRPSTGAVAGSAVAGGAAAAFLNKPESLQRPAAGDRADRVDNRAERAGDRVDNRADRVDNRIDRRPERIENRDVRWDQRHDRRDQVRDQFKEHHPRYDFWQDHPHWARWRWTRPYRWATWAAITNWFPWNWGAENYYYYGENIYYEGDTVYYGDKAVATSEKYAQQAQDLASSAPEPAADSEWMPLGVFALTPDGQASGEPPTIFLQLTVNKEGIIAGTVTNTQNDQGRPVEGMVDKKTQRTAWVVQGKSSPIMETGLANLTKDEAPALLHFADGQTQQWLMVRLEDPEGQAATQ